MLRLLDFFELSRRAQGDSFYRLPYMEKICDALEKVVTGEIHNLILTVAPRHYKTSIVNHFVAWCHGEISPDCEFITTSAASTLAFENCTNTRRIYDYPWYRDSYLTRISPDKDTKEYFKTVQGGSLYAQGLGGMITGFGAGKTRLSFGGAILIDDPLKPVDAESPQMLQKCIDYYTTTLKSRRNHGPSTPFIVLMQRLANRDLVNYLLTRESNLWTLINFPAVDEEAKTVLNPHTTSYEDMMVLKETAPQTYYSQYQQQPQAVGGSIIKPSWWKVVTEKEAKNQKGLTFITMDTSFKEKSTSDPSVMRCWRATPDSLYSLDARWGRWSFPELWANAQLFIKHCEEHYDLDEAWIEDRASGTPLIQSAQDAGVNVQAWLPSKFKMPVEKVGRMRIAAFPTQAGKVKLIGMHNNQWECYSKNNQRLFRDKYEKIQIGPKDDEYIVLDKASATLVNECANFSADMTHDHDDHCDTFTMAISLWLDAGGKAAPEQEEPESGFTSIYAREDAYTEFMRSAGLLT